MKEYGLVDLSNPQWLERRLREYTVKQVFDTVAASHTVDWQYQYHVYLVEVCNQLFAHESEKEDSHFCKSIRENLKWSQKEIQSIADLGLQKIIGGSARLSTNHCDGRPITEVNALHICPFFELYRASNGLREEDAVRSILRKYGNTYNEWYEDFCLSKNYNWVRTLSSVPEYFIVKDKSNCIYCLRPKENTGELKLMDDEIIKRRENDFAIFLIDSFDVADNLQKQYDEKYGDFIKKTQTDFWQKIYDANSQIRYCGNEPKSTVMAEIKTLAFYNKTLTRTCTNIIWSSWFGGYDLLDRVDWTPLQGHPVYLFQVNVDKKTALERFVKVGESFSKLPDTDLSLVWLERKTDPNNLEKNPFNLFTYNEALESAHELSIELSNTQDSILAQHLRDQGRAPRHEGRYLIDPIIRQNSFVVLSGLEGCGKSWLAMGMGAAMATRGKLFYDWDVRKKAKVVYLADDEMDSDLLDDRREVLRKLYRNYAENFAFESIHRTDLTDASEREKIETIIDQLWLKMDERLPSVLILDHLNKLTNNKGNTKEFWTVVRKWIEDLNKKKITVILIHHEYVKGKMTGTVLIPQDADVHIHVQHGDKDCEKHEIEIVYTVPKNKGAKDQREPKSVILDLRKSKWHTQDELMPPQRDWYALTDEERKSQVEKLFETMTIRQIAVFFGRSKSSIEKFCMANKISKRHRPKQNVTDPSCDT